MYDEDGPRVARAIYRAVFRNCPEDATSLAAIDMEAIPRALDEAVREMRAEGLPPRRWAQFIHYGM